MKQCSGVINNTVPYRSSVSQNQYRESTVIIKYKYNEIKIGISVVM